MDERDRPPRGSGQRGPILSANCTRRRGTPVSELTKRRKQRVGHPPSEISHVSKIGKPLRKLRATLREAMGHPKFNVEPTSQDAGHPPMGCGLRRPGPRMRGAPSGGEGYGDRGHPPVEIESEWTARLRGPLIAK